MDFGREFGKLCVKNQIEVIALCRTKPAYGCEFIKTDLTNEKIHGKCLRGDSEKIQKDRCSY